MEMSISTVVDIVKDIGKNLNSEKTNKEVTNKALGDTYKKDSKGTSFKELLEVKKTETTCKKDKKSISKDDSLEEEIVLDEEAIKVLQNVVEVMKDILANVENIDLDGLKEEIKVGNLDVNLDLLQKEDFNNNFEIMDILKNTITKEEVQEIQNSFFENSALMNTLDEEIISKVENIFNSLTLDNGKIEEISLIEKTPLIKEVIDELEKVKDTQKVKVDENFDNSKELENNFIKLDNRLTNIDKNYENNTSKENLSKEQDNSKDVIKKEDKVLKGIIDDETTDNVTNKFTLFNERITTNFSGKVTTNEIVINKENIVQDIVKSIKYIENNNIKELTVNINPRDLGEISIRLVQEDGIMKTNIKANSKETYELLSQHLSEIKKVLGEQNIKVSEVNISLYNEDTTFFKNEEFNNNFFQGQERSNDPKENNTYLKEDEELIEVINEAEDLRNVNMLA